LAGAGHFRNGHLGSRFRPGLRESAHSQWRVAFLRQQGKSTPENLNLILQLLQGGLFLLQDFNDVLHGYFLSNQSLDLIAASRGLREVQNEVAGITANIAGHYIQQLVRYQSECSCITSRAWKRA
jgi:hypothetical protein